MTFYWIFKHKVQSATLQEENLQQNFPPVEIVIKYRIKSFLQKYQNMEVEVILYMILSNILCGLWIISCFQNQWKEEVDNFTIEKQQLLKQNVQATLVAKRGHQDTATHRLQMMDSRVQNYSNTRNWNGASNFILFVLKKEKTLA